MPCSECGQTRHNAKRCPDVFLKERAERDAARAKWIAEQLLPALSAPDPMPLLRALEVEGTWLRHATRGFCAFLRGCGAPSDLVERYPAWRTEDRRRRPTKPTLPPPTPTPAPAPPSDPPRPARRVKRSRSTLPAG